MRKRVQIALAVLLVVIAGLITLAFWPSQCPIELKSITIEPADIIDSYFRVWLLVVVTRLLTVHPPVFRVVARRNEREFHASCVSLTQYLLALTP